MVVINNLITVEKKKEKEKRKIYVKSPRTEVGKRDFAGF